MTKRNNEHAQLAAQIRSHLAARFEDVTVQIAEGVHYKGLNLIITTAAFDGLLPEQRFHHVVRSLPADFYEQNLRRGFVWFELAPGQSGVDYMRMPRSQDVAARESAILRRLERMDFFETLSQRLGPKAPSASIDDFVLSRRILEEAGLSRDEITQSCLLFIRHGGFCDAQVLADVAPGLSAQARETSRG